MQWIQSCSQLLWLFIYLWIASHDICLLEVKCIHHYFDHEREYSFFPWQSKKPLFIREDMWEVTMVDLPMNFRGITKPFYPIWYDGFYWDSLYVWLARLIHYWFGFCIIKLVILSLSPLFSLFTSRILRFLLIASFCIMKILARYDAESKFARYWRGQEVLICLVICHAVLINFVPIHSSL
jgi:hypothetical protein